MKRIIATLCTLTLILACIFVPATAEEPFYAQGTVKVSYFSGTPDYEWYGDGTAAEFTLSSADALVGFRDLVNANRMVDGVYTKLAAPVTFQGKTVKLAVDVVINKGDSSAWTVDNTTGLYEWIPIGHTKDLEALSFQGSFDGQGHYISGVYMNAKWSANPACQTFNRNWADGRDAGFFGRVQNGTVKNFAILNSAFLNSGKDSGGAQGNGVVSRLAGSTISGVYSEARMKGGFATGGMVGYLQKSDGVVENCVFAGEIDYSLCNKAIGMIVGMDECSSAVIRNCLSLGTAVNACTHGCVGKLRCNGSKATMEANYSSLLDTSEAVNEAVKDNAAWKLRDGEYPMPATVSTMMDLIRAVDAPIDLLYVQSTRLQGDTYDIRFIAGLDSLDYDAANVTVNVNSTAGTQNRVFRYENIRTAYRSITAETEAGLERVTAPDGTYFIAFVIRNVPVSEGTVTFTVTPEVTSAGAVTAGMSYEIVLTGGRFVSARAIVE